MSAPVIQPLGLMQYLKSLTATTHIYAVIGDGETPDGHVATMEIAGDQATLVIPALVGPQGPAGEHAFALRLQVSTIDDPEDLPTNLTNTDDDIGKYWVINQYDVVNEVQTIAVTGGATAFTLTYDGQPTTSITGGATSAALQAALEALANIAPGDVAVAGVAGGPYAVTFTGTKAGLNQPPITGAATGGTSPAVNVVTNQQGGTNLIGSRAYVWFGDHYRVIMMGTEGPPGPVPLITWGVELLDPDGGVESYMSQSGSPYAPSVIAHLAVPRGPQGPAGNLSQSPDVDMSNPPTHLQVLAFDANILPGGKWRPMSIGAIIPRPYTVPEAAFTNYQGISTRAPIGSFAVPAQPFPWKPIVFGHIKATGLELDSDPLIIGCEIRLGHPTSGQLIARGFGNTASWAHMMPHASSTADPTIAITPDNSYALVPANHTGMQGTLYVNLYNDGLAGAYLFNKANAQLYVQVTPV
ncbi:Bacteriophage minor tail subunit [Mycobacteroides abscessus subsp. massiliense]|uniref:hypothetical protein n=1 Tax=Mycobacteroides abscessus TaxID=36809 RepID=UPI0009A730AD|nr:hypothetical protein [Mycobacteroides abscessus]SLC03796.1 Bacteriophage minor tail subunit [Mycobacteroides abscessus subsp. massiliense]